MIQGGLTPKGSFWKGGAPLGNDHHTCLNLLYLEGVDLMTLKELAGHDDLGSTEIYAHADMGDVRKVVEKHPLG